MKAILAGLRRVQAQAVALGALLGAMLGLASCAGVSQPVPEAEEKALSTDGVIARYHAVLNTPYSQPLLQNGYIIGIEKAPRAPLSAPETQDTARFRAPFAIPATGTARDLAQQQAQYRRVTSNPKIMFVSHVLRYHGDDAGQRIVPSLVYSAYSRTALPPAETCPEAATSAGAYAAGWAALECLERTILADIATARVPYTHLLFLSMGWNNDQFEALERYNAIVSMTRRAAVASGDGAAFNPLVIGITWPSVWGGTSVVDIANRALHIGSYPVKADDADEIGYGIANHVMNAMMPRIEAATGLKPVAIGHSMGARVLTRAYYSADVLKAPVPRAGAGPMVLSLQGAFSANRFRPDFELIWPVRLVASGEGGPYQDHAAPGGQVVMTWSKKDYANPFARLLSGAAHVGGPVGTPVLREVEAERAAAGQPGFLAEIGWPKGRRAGPETCAALRAEVGPEARVLNVDASEVIENHGDIRNRDVGEIAWSMISCFQP